MGGEGIPRAAPFPQGGQAMGGTSLAVTQEDFLRVPTDTGNPGKPGKMRQLFPVREKSGNFKKILKSQGKVREF